jgi:hypothetical protein
MTMHDLEILRDAWAQPDPPAPAAQSAARTAVLERAAAPGPARPRWGTAPGRRGRRGVRPVAVAAVSLALAVAVTAVAVQGGGAGPGAGLTVQELAYRTAATAAAGPGVRPGQWVYWEEKQVGSKPAWPAFHVWTTADSRQAAYLDHGKVRIIRPNCTNPAKNPATLAPSSASGCYFTGQPAVSGGGVYLSEVYGPMPVSYAGLSALPRDPLALNRYLGRLHLPGWGPAPFREFEIVVLLLTTYMMPPALTAELYRSLGLIPGVTVNHHAVDVAGRTGVGFQIPVPPWIGGGTDTLIINPRTYRLMGQQLMDTAGKNAGRASSGMAVLRRVLVSGPGVAP